MPANTERGEVLISAGHEAPIDERFWYRPQRVFNYKATPQGELTLIVDYPYDWNIGDRRPAIVFFYGGGFTCGTPEQFTRQATYFAGRGLVCVRADYRVRDRHHATPEQSVEDAFSCMRWVRGNAGMLGVDPGRIVAGGGSAGGYLAAAVGTLPDWPGPDDDLGVSPRPNALLLFNPAVGLHRDPLMSAHSRQSWPDWHPDAEMVQRLYTPDYVDDSLPPTWIWFGTEDRLLESAEPFITKARAVGKLDDLMLAHGADHGYFNDYERFFRTSLYRAETFLRNLGYIAG